MTQNLIRQFQEELDKLTEKTNLLTDRIKVMQARKHGMIKKK